LQHAAYPNLDGCTSFFGVYDGHGGNFRLFLVCLGCRLLYSVFLPCSKKGSNILLYYCCGPWGLLTFCYLIAYQHGNCSYAFIKYWMCMACRHICLRSTMYNTSKHPLMYYGFFPFWNPLNNCIVLIC
jgi:hypothetical protein